MIQDILVDKSGKKLQYRNDTMLHRAGTQLQYTDEHIKEWIKCSEDPLYFINTYCKIQDPNKGLSQVTLRPYQEKLIIDLLENKYVIIMFPRQSGKSMTLSLFTCWEGTFKNDITSGVFANKEKISKEIFSRIMLTYRLLPHFLKGGVEEFNKTTLELENGSRIISGATSESGPRGFTINGTLIIDEAAHISTSLFQSFYDSCYPTVSAAEHGRIVLISTPNGMNHFHRLWKDAEQGHSSYKPVSVDWKEIPGRDDEWKKKEIKNMNGNIEKFTQEYECKFVGNSRCLFSSRILENIEFKPALPLNLFDNEHLFIYEQPSTNGLYCLCCDVSEGKNNDYSVISVIDITSIPYKQVAIYRDNTIHTYPYAYVIEKLAQLYNDALVLVENNSIGDGVINTLIHEVGYENVYIGEDGNIGVRTSSKTKQIGMLHLKELLEKQALKIYSYETLVEMSNFVKTGYGYAAAQGQHDDIIMTLVLFGYLYSTDYFKELTSDGIDIAKQIYHKNIQQIIDEDAMPIYHVDGNTETIMSGGLQKDDNDGFHNPW
jgi:hypothetical protein